MAGPVLNGTFTLFVYGTLKRGYENHERLCEGVLGAEEAVVRGRLYGLPFGFPALVVAEGTVHIPGTTDPLHDAAACRRAEDLATEGPTDGPLVYGEVLTFDDAEARLPLFDRLEGFDPDGPSLYRRVLVPAETVTSSLLAWAYVIERPAGDHLPDGRWPA